MPKDNKNSGKELYFTVLGPSGAGKTTMLACMYNEFEDLRSGMLVPDAQTSRIMQIAYSRLKNSANSSSSEFETAIEGTEDMREYRFDIKGKTETLPIRFYDFPGGWMDPSKKEYAQVEEIVRKSAAILVAINTPYVMEEDGLYAEEGISGATIQNLIANSYNTEDSKNNTISRNKLIWLKNLIANSYNTEDSKNNTISRNKLILLQNLIANSCNTLQNFIENSYNTLRNLIANSHNTEDSKNNTISRNKLILLVPIKCEKYTRTIEDTRRMCAKLKEKGIFKRTVGLMNNPAYADNTAMAILPIHTVGNAEFERFKKDRDGKIVGEVYKKIQGEPFSPMDTEQPIRFVMSFLLNEIARIKSAEIEAANSGFSWSGAAKGAAIGAAIGSFIPFIGTGIGAGIGGFLGGLGGLVTVNKKS